MGNSQPKYNKNILRVSKKFTLKTFTFTDTSFGNITVQVTLQNLSLKEKRYYEYIPVLLPSNLQHEIKYYEFTSRDHSSPYIAGLTINSHSYSIKNNNELLTYTPVDDYGNDINITEREYMKFNNKFYKRHLKTTLIHFHLTKSQNVLDNERQIYAKFIENYYRRAVFQDSNVIKLKIYNNNKNKMLFAIKNNIEFVNLVLKPQMIVLSDDSLLIIYNVVNVLLSDEWQKIYNISIENEIINIEETDIPIY